MLVEPVLVEPVLVEPVLAVPVLAVPATRLFAFPVAQGPDDEGAGSGQDPAGVSRAFGVPIRELHPGIESPGLAFDQVAPGINERLGRGNPDRSQTGRTARSRQLSGEHRHG